MDRPEMKLGARMSRIAAPHAVDAQLPSGVMEKIFS